MNRVSAFSPLSGASEHSTSKSRRTDDASTSSFAGIMTDAVHRHVPKHHVAKKKEGTSELDAPKDEASAKATGANDGEDATSATSTASTSAVVRSLGALDPTLQAKLARVMERVRNETGHHVSVAETYRTQARQDALYAQGRDTAGPVVTWTTNSKHTQGRAVDLVLDGGAAGSDAYAALQRIAKEEGLHTLGARDPGHLELPNSGAQASTDVTALTPAAPADATGPGQVAVARLAQLARVADVKTDGAAAVARVATVARPGVSAKGASNAGAKAPAQAIHAAAMENAAKDLAAQSGDTDGSDANARGDDQRGGYDAFAGGNWRGHQSASFSLDSIANTTAATGTTAAERVARVQEALDNASPRSLSSLTMAVDAGNGSTDRIQVSLRGAALNTTIDASDARGAHAMSSRADELVRALSRDGVEVESLRVRATASTATVAPQQTQNPSDSSNHSRFDRGQAWQQQQDRQRSNDDRRQQQQRRNSRGGQPS